MRYGMKGKDIKGVQTILLEQGFFEGTPLGNFKKLTRAAVKYFQGTHIGEDGEFLLPDAEVGPKTWWALYNPTGTAQQSGIEEPEIVDILVPGENLPSTLLRLDMVRFMYALHKKGVREEPDGSNYGDGVTPIVNACGYKYGIAWCMAQASYGFQQALNKKPLGAMHVGTATFWNEAVKAGVAHPKKRYTACPGDIAIYNYGRGLYSNGRLSGSGHATVVVRVDVDGKRHNAIEGNAGNRCKHSIRNESERTLIGYVNLFGDDAAPPCKAFPRGVQQRPTLELSLQDSR